MCVRFHFLVRCSRYHVYVIITGFGNGIYDKVIEKTLGSRQEYYIGIRGNTTRIFDIFFQKANSQELQKIRTYRGQAELDYTIWTRNSVFLFEAKQVKQGSVEYYLDTAWHKFAYAGVRFLNYQNLDVLFEIKK
jgi:hypothetical protein